MKTEICDICSKQTDDNTFVLMIKRKGGKPLHKWTLCFKHFRHFEMELNRLKKIAELL